MFAATFADPWRFEPNVEVYVLVAFLVGAYMYAVRYIGPHAVEPGQPVVTRRQVGCFVGALVLLFTASTWPIHQIGESYLYSVHMLQHMMLSYFMPPLVLLATPEWLARALVGEGRAYRVVRVLSKPVLAAVLFNVAVVVTHVPGVVNTGTADPVLHYLLHVMVVTAALIMWMPVLGPFPELHLSPLAKLPYLFAQSVLPTVPAGWLTFADDTVYHHYSQPVRVWGLSPTDDQQIAGAIMKTGGGIFLWTVILVMFIRRVAPDWRQDAALRRRSEGDVPLTFEDVSAEFARTPAPPEPPSAPRHRAT
jgi:putative membrane protein